MSSLPNTADDEKLLRARVHALVAKAARELGKEETEFVALERTLRIDGGMVRRMGLSLPAKFQGSGGLGKRLARGLFHSPRFESGKAFVVEAQSEQDHIKICLRNHRGEQIRCSESDRMPAQSDPDEQSDPSKQGKADAEADPAVTNKEVDMESDDAFIERMARLFQHELFAADVRISQVDMGSLDGRVTSGSQVARERLERMLEHVAE